MAWYGKCLCGASKIELRELLPRHYICHCTDCKQTSGSGLTTYYLAPKEEVWFDGATGEYKSLSASGNTVTRVFCTKCGSALSHKSDGFGDFTAVHTGNFPHVFGRLEAELFVKWRWGMFPRLPDVEQREMGPDSYIIK